MKDIPMLFAPPMVRALLREIRAPGTGKTQTRRIDKCIPISEPQQYDVGDRIWVRETWQTHSWAADCVTTRYAAEASSVGFSQQTEQIPYPEGDKNAFKFVAAKGPDFWRPSIHMPRWASRITLEVTDVRHQPLRDISIADARAEGVEPLQGGYRDYGHADIAFGGKGAALFSFISLWDSINGTPRKKDGPDISWRANPRVVAVTFRPHLCNIDRMEMAA